MIKKTFLIFSVLSFILVALFLATLNAKEKHPDACPCCAHYDTVSQNQSQENQIYIEGSGDSDNIDQANESTDDYDQMDQANEAAGDLLRIKMEQQDPHRYAIWDSVEDSDIIVVSGVYDRVEDVLDAGRTPYSYISPAQLSDVNLDPDQLLMINCPGDLDRGAISKIEKFVKEGGYLFTTDWCLLNVLEQAFPGFVEYNNIPTADDVVEVQLADKSNPLLLNVMDTSLATPCWWLEISSYPITVLNENKVNVLISSKEMERKYGEPSIAVTFRYGDGKIIHMTSHFYLQRSDTRYDRQSQEAEYYVEEELNVNLDSPEGKELQEDLDGLNLGEIENATTNQQFIVNVIVDRKETQD